MEIGDIRIIRNFYNPVQYNEESVFHASVCSIENYPLHQHSDMEIIWVISGCIKVDTIYELFTMSEGDLLLIDMDDFHSISGEGNENEILIVNLKNDFIKKLYGDLFSYFICEWVDGNRKSAEKIVQLKRLIVGILELYLKKEGHQDNAEIEYLSSELINILFKDFNLISYYKPFETISQSQEERFQNITRYLFDNYKEKIKLSDISERENIETTYLSHLLKKISSFSFEEHLEFLRTTYALDLLLKTDLSVIEISLEAGFSDTKYLYKGFSKWFNNSPGVIRKKYIAESRRPSSFLHKSPEHCRSALRMIKDRGEYQPSRSKAKYWTSGRK